MPANRSVATSHLSMWRIQTDRTTHSLPTYIRRASKKTLSQGTGNSHRRRERTSRRFTCNGKLDYFEPLLFFVHYPIHLFLWFYHKSNPPPPPSVTCPITNIDIIIFTAFNIISWAYLAYPNLVISLLSGPTHLVVRYAETYTGNFLIYWNCLRWEGFVRRQIIFSWVSIMFFHDILSVHMI